MTMKSLDLQLNLVALAMVCVEVSRKGNIPIYYKATGIDMQNIVVTGVIVVHTVIVI